MDARLVVVHRLGIAMLVATFCVPAVARLGAQQAAVDCAAARMAGTSPVGCFALVPSSPYHSAGTGNTALGADAARLSGLLECAMGGDSLSAACQQWELSRTADALMCIE
jgi:hypothetical protein